MISRYYIICFTCIGFLNTTGMHAQEQDTMGLASEILEQTIESFAENSETELDYSDLNQDLESFQERPVNLNSPSIAELSRLPLLNELQVLNLQTYVRQYGQVASIYELQLIDGFSQQFIEQIAPYITLDFTQSEPFNWKKAWKHSRSSLSLRYQHVLETQSGYEKVSDSIKNLHPNDYFIGSPDSYLLKFSSSYRDRLKYGFLAEKDPGEALFAKQGITKNGFDFYSGFLYVRDAWKFKHIALGDYHIHFGQGLTFWNGLSFGTAAGILPMRKRSAPISPSGSSNESSFLRGVAATITFGRFDITGFYSNCRRDGNLNPADSVHDEEAYVSSIQSSGYHRTLNELSDRKVNREVISGGNISYRGGQWHLGFSTYHLQYQKKIKPESELYIAFQHDRTTGNYAGFDFSYSYKRLVLYGESSLQFDGESAHLLGFSFSPDPRLSMACVYRNYSSGYSNSFASAFGSNSSNTNERAIYLGMTTTPSRNLSITASTDFSRFPWLRYRVDSPSRAYLFSLFGSYTPGRKTRFNFRYGYYDKPLNKSDPDSPLPTPGQTLKSTYNVQFRHEVTEWLTIGNRILYQKFCTDNHPISSGYFLSQDLQVNRISNHWALSVSYMIFDTDSYDSRVYAYEHDLPSSFSVPALSGSGSRYYIMLRLDFFNNIDFWIKFSSSVYPGLKQVSDGLTKIDGCRKSEVKIMLKLKMSY
jgi:hypothetical protein